MSLPHILSDEAQAEFDEAYGYLDAIRTELAEDFAAQVLRAVGSITANPRIGTEVAPGVRRIVLRKLRYSIFYREANARIEVIAVFHTSRDPAEWQRRV